MSESSSRLGRLRRFVGLTGGFPAYQCRGCRAGFDVQFHVCPDCGGYSVEAVYE